MRTLDKILEGVTAGGQWELGASDYILWGSGKEMSIGRLDHAKDAAYAARAARNFPALVRALDLALSCAPKHRVEPNWIGEARAALNDALKD